MAAATKAEKLLVAAAKLFERAHREFTIEDLVVGAHRLFPDDFSLKGYREFPDSNAVFTQMMGKSAALITRGWLEKTGTKRFRLTPKGLNDFGQMDLGDGSNTGKASLHRAQDEAMGRLLTSDAFGLFKERKQEQITFNQFCRFVGLSARDEWQKVQGKLTTVKYLVEEARKIGEAGQTFSVFYRRKITPTPDEMRSLEALLGFMQERFRSQMEEWRRKEFR